MLRSLYSGISGLRAHQTMLDVTGNNIANVNTTAFKSSSTQFQDTLSQVVQGAGGAQAEVGGTNPAQIGLGVQVAGISTNFTQGATQSTGRATDLMIAGDGFFIVNAGGETLYTRAGSFDFDTAGRLVTPDGAIVQGWQSVNGQLNEGGVLGPITLPTDAVSAPTPTTGATVTGNLPSDAPNGTELVRDIVTYDASGAERTLSVSFSRDANGVWSAAAEDANGTTQTTNITFVDGRVTGGGALTVDGIAVDLSGVTNWSGPASVSISDQNGSPSGTLTSWSLGKDGILTGSFSNGDKVPLARIALANFVNPGGLEKTGSSAYRPTVNSGDATVGAPGQGGTGALVAGALEMSNVDLSAEFTNLIVAQRGFQANARIITTSDEVLQELTSLKR
ncbi:flagellar hook protein FlgE [Herbiconiux sp. SYSU D00978]|uniref:flagellar hook protein FlgE n=1 Tax=Herbiconiux sp. SYSU D00978 TaxID=2812562 RepID=UPI001A97439B|nr:flagellar hook protein FlgE [Herbiconiux sp. SYSU D00978]